MKIMVVSSPHAFATRDVFTSHVAGLKAILGEENVVTYDVIPRYNLFHSWCNWLEEQMGFVPREVRANVLAAEPVFGAAHFHNCDTVYWISPMYFPMSMVEMFRKDGFRCWVYFTECPYEDEFWARSQSIKFDHCFVNDLNSINRFRAFNENTHYLPHSFDPAKHYPLWEQPNDHEHVIFVGTDFKGRRKLFGDVDWSGIDFRLYGNWQDIKEDTVLDKFVRRRLVDNHTTAGIYRGSVVGISMHRQERQWDSEEVLDKGEAYSMGPRSYELAACGLYQISDYRPELVEVFGDTVPIFETADQLEYEVRWALEHPEERQRRARAQWKAVQGHTAQSRMKQLLEIVA